MDASTVSNQAVNIDEAINITSGNRKYQKFMVLVLGIGASSVSPLFLSSQFFIPTSNELKHLDSSAIHDSEIHQVDNQQNIIFKDFLFTGVMLGSLIIPWIADSFGRKKIVKNSCVIGAISLVVAALSTTINMLYIAGLMVGFSFAGLVLISIILVVESLDFKNRASYFVIYPIFWYLNSAFAITLSFLEFYWRYTLLICAGLLWIEFFLLDYVHESPRLLLVNVVNIEECTNIMNSISQMNGEENFLYTLTSDNIKSKSTRSIRDLLANKMIIIKILAGCVVWVCIFRGFYMDVLIISLYRAEFYLLSIGTHIIYALSGLVTVYFINNFGRKLAIILALLVIGALFLCIGIVNLQNDKVPGIIIQILSIAQKFIVTGAMWFLFIFTAEQFPTYIRCTCFGICSIAGRIGALIAVT